MTVAARVTTTNFKGALHFPPGGEWEERDIRGYPLCFIKRRTSRHKFPAAISGVNDPRLYSSESYRTPIYISGNTSASRATGRKIVSVEFHYHKSTEFTEIDVTLMTRHFSHREDSLRLSRASRRVIKASN